MNCTRRLKSAPICAGIAFAIAGPPAAAAPRVQDPDSFICQPRDQVPAAELIQQCVDRAPAFSTVEIPQGTYVLDHQIVVSSPLTIRTAGTIRVSCVVAPEACAVLIAGPDLADEWGLLVVRSTTNVRLEHLVIDGNRARRTASAAARFCTNGDTAYGFNAAVLECEECGLEDVVSSNALCGTGMVWSGAKATVEHSAFRSNGDAATQNMWADGLTMVYAPRSVVLDNTFEDNSDVALIIGFGVESRIERNRVVQRTQPAFAGLMLDNFNSDDRRVRGDFRGGIAADNAIDCGPQLCTFGIQVGPRPWYQTPNIIGGELHDNTVKGAKIGINVDGAGERDAPTAIYNNSVESVSPGAYFTKCALPIPADWMNIAPTSFVDRRDEHTPVGSHLSDFCQLTSSLSTD